MKLTTFPASIHRQGTGTYCQNFILISLFQKYKKRVNGRLLSIMNFLYTMTITRHRKLATFPASIHRFDSGNLLPNLHINQPLPEMSGEYPGACCRSRHMLLHYDNLQFTGNYHISWFISQI
jgi:hypothetical protein